MAVRVLPGGSYASPVPLLCSARSGGAVPMGGGKPRSERNLVALGWGAGVPFFNVDPRREGRITVYV